MLQHLFIKDFVVVSQADITFEKGMTVITGETGAGKSILLEALQLALGERAESHYIRPGQEKAEIAATFDVSSLPMAILWLNDLALNHDEANHLCIIRRVLYANGRSRAFINDRPVTTTQLRLLGEYLLQIHGQHQHQSLLKPQEQLRLLDAFGQHHTLVSQVKTAFKAFEKSEHQFQLLKEQYQAEQALSSLLQYQLAELEALSLQENEFLSLHEEHDRLCHAQNYIHACEEAIGLLDGEEPNVRSLLYQIQQKIKPLSSKFKALLNVESCLDSAQIQVQEALSELNTFVVQLEVNPNRLNEVSRRLEQIHDIARKHKVEPEDLSSHLHTLKTKAAKWENAEEVLMQLAKEMQLAREQYKKCAGELSKVREKARERLANEVSKHIQTLGMPGAIFTIDLIKNEDNSLHAHGNETALFGISANLGHPPLPLSKVASGGELSRISLALELISAAYLATPCLIFDEVDVGISGKVGAIVGKALFNLSKAAQVLCITHLPQVAAFGHNHLLVSKTPSQQETLTLIQPLSEKERIEEIARMLGGLNVTTQARANAKQLLAQRGTPEPA